MSQTSQNTHNNSRRCAVLCLHLFYVTFSNYNVPISTLHLGDLPIYTNHPRFSLRLPSLINLPSLLPIKLITLLLFLHDPRTNHYFNKNLTILQLTFAYQSPSLKKNNCKDKKPCFTFLCFPIPTLVFHTF